MKAAIYCRLSKEDRDKLRKDDDSGSIRNQKALLINYAHSRGWMISDIYSDDDYTGTDRNRPEFKRLLADAEARKFDLILCKTQSRFTRELEIVEKYIHGLFPLWGIRFVSIVDNGDTGSKGNKKSRQINGLVNEWYLEDLSENIRSVLTSKRQRGLHIGPFAPYGYRKDPAQKGHLLIDPEAAEVVRTVFRLYVEGHGKTAIARALNTRGIPNPTEYKRRHGHIRNKKDPSNSTLWSYCTIADMLTNEVYIGNLVQGKSAVVSYKEQEKKKLPPDRWIIVNGTHEPIIDKSLWDQTQRLLSRKSVPAGGAEEGIFSRKVRCAQCGYHLHSVKNGSKRGFSCRTHRLSPNACAGASISLPKLERIVLAELHTFNEELLDPDALAEGIDAAPGQRKMRTELRDALLHLGQKLNQNQTELRRRYLDKVEGVLPEKDYLAVSADLTAERARLQSQVDEITGRLRQIDLELTNQEDKRTIIREYTQSRTLSRDMVDALIDHILVGKRDPQTRLTPVEIHWSF